MNSPQKSIQPQLTNANGYTQKTAERERQRQPMAAIHANAPVHQLDNISLFAPLRLKPVLPVNHPTDVFEQEAGQPAVHVMQQQPHKRRSGILMRRLAVQNPAQTHPPATGQSTAPTNASMFEDMLREISPEGGIRVNRSNGEASMSTGFCPGVGGGFLQGVRSGYDIGNTIGSVGGRVPVLGPLFGVVGAAIGGLIGAVGGLFGADISAASNSTTPTGSLCLCEFVNSGEMMVEFRNDHSPVTGEGLIYIPTPDSPRQWGAATVSGALMDIPPWLALAHELCGHAYNMRHPAGDGSEEGPGIISDRTESADGTITNGDGSPLRPNQATRHGRTVERENMIRAEHGIEARGYRLRDPYCGESFYRDRGGADTSVHWQPGEAGGETYLDQCERFRAQLPQSRVRRYRIDERIPE